MFFNVACAHQMGSVRSNDSLVISRIFCSFQNFLLFKTTPKTGLTTQMNERPWNCGISLSSSIYPEQLCYRLYANWIMLSSIRLIIVVFLTNQAPPDYTCHIWRVCESSAGLRLPLFTCHGMNMSVKPWSSYYRWFCTINNSIMVANIRSVLGL